MQTLFMAFADVVSASPMQYNVPYSTVPGTSRNFDLVIENDSTEIAEPPFISSQ
ncbi:unnamed protein product, partial [Didymodactylos carnosus]